MDSESIKKLNKTPEFYKRVKHIDRQYHYCSIAEGALATIANTGFYLYRPLREAYKLAYSDYYASLSEVASAPAANPAPASINDNKGLRHEVAALRRKRLAVPNVRRDLAFYSVRIRYFLPLTFYYRGGRPGLVRVIGRL
ncbi:hypothetical protein ACRALDRAFT_1069305 [Sodiomyces alcalophilus JCM 7366]|uniref:uncharacterized protein n=1 Tax=Sodiomyces alcalophilus JCM 7366 TaxID=591952 RepID=UPI0039B539D6